MFDLAYTRSELEDLLRQDVPYGDLTTQTLGIEQRNGVMRFTARDAMTCSAVEEAAALLETAGASVTLAVSSGTPLASGDLILTAKGQARALFKGWKCAQTLIEASSGISSRAAEFVAAAPGVVVACTRKHFPGTKAVATKAIRAGGAQMHRLGLSETLMVTAEHRAFLSEAEGSSYVSTLQKRQPEKKVLIEVSSADAARGLLRQGAQTIQLEKIAPHELSALVIEARRLPRYVTLIAAGGISLRNVGAYAATGVDVLVTSAPFFAPPLDVQVHFERVE